MLFKTVVFPLLVSVLLCGMLTGCEKPVLKPHKKSEKPALPPLDMERIAADEAHGIKFSSDKRTLLEYNTDLKDPEYTVPDGVTAIGKRAFYRRGRGSLKRVTLPSSVTTIGHHAFLMYPNIEKINLPPRVTTIGMGAFLTCGKIEVSPDNPRFYNDAFGALIDRKEKTLLHVPSDISGGYTIPAEVTAIGLEAFWRCENLTEVTIPSGVTTIGDGAFANCGKLKSVTMPPGVTSIGMKAFSYCPNLTVINIPEGVKNIGAAAFNRCSGLTVAMLPSSLETIGDWAFHDCEKLTDVTIPSGIKSIGKGAFLGSPCEASVKKQFPNYRSW